MSIPHSWVRTTVGELFEVVGGGTPSTAVAEYWMGDIPWISSADIDDSHKIATRRFITKDAVDNSATNIVPPGSVVVVTRVGLGKVAIAPTSMCFSQDSQALITNAGALNEQYVLLYLSTAVEVFKHISRGTTISGVTKKQLLKLSFLLPPRPEQDRIVAEIETLFTDLDASVAALKRVQANLKRYRASVLKAACEGRLVPTEAELARKEGRSYETGEQLLTRILKERRAKWEADQLAKMLAAGKPPQNDDWKKKYKEPTPPVVGSLPALPDGWVWASTEQISVKVVDGVHKKPDYKPAGIPFVTVRNLTASPGINLTNLNHVSVEDHLEFIKRANPERGDLLITKDGTLGVIRAIRTDQAFSIFVSVAMIKPAMAGLTDYLEIALSSPQVQIQMVPKGSGLQHIHLEDLREDCIPLAPLTEQKRIAEEVEARLTSADAVEVEVVRSVKRAGRLRQAILKHSFEGKLVPQDPSDEPASVLLDRIRAERANKTGLKSNAKQKLAAAMAEK